MKIKLNGQEKEFAGAQTLQSIIEQFCREHRRIIAEVNGEIVKSPRWVETLLKDGDAIELVSFVGGG